ncbi:MAG: hypothetical protein OEQ74_07375 [Gammaproteobacteria bacterium]|nr:hypothetical protein [Gammaproteobacteria bacterium]
MTDMHENLPWHRQFWPWFIIVLIGSTVIASLATVWIAVVAAPDRVDGAGLFAVPVRFSADREILFFDMGLPPPGESWPQELGVTLVARNDGSTQELQASRIDERNYETPVELLVPGSYKVTLQADGSRLTLQGNWAYPAPVWKLEEDE